MKDVHGNDMASVEAGPRIMPSAGAGMPDKAGGPLPVQRPGKVTRDNNLPEDSRIEGPVVDSELLTEGLATADTETESSVSSEGILLMFLELGGDSDEEYKRDLCGSGLNKGEHEEDLQAPLASSYKTSRSDMKAVGVGVQADNNTTSRTVFGLDSDDGKTAHEVPLSAEKECRARHKAEEHAVQLKVIEELAECKWGKDWKSQWPPPFDWAQRAEPAEPETPSWTLEDWHYAQPVAVDSTGDRMTVPDVTVKWLRHS